MLKVNDPLLVIPSNLWLTIPLGEQWKNSNLEFFDKDGFDLNIFEQAAYKENGVHFSDGLNRQSVQFKWFDNTTNNRVKVDHSYVLCRYGYGGYLRQQIEQWAKDKPVFNKLLQLRPKWGLDVDLEYYFDYGEVIDLLHLEYDSFNFDGFMLEKQTLEKLLPFLDYEKGAEHFKQQSSVLNTLTGDDKNDFKARYFGFARSYTTYQVI